MKAYYIKQGDEYSIPIRITADGVPATNDTLSAVEVMVGRGLRKTWPGELVYDKGCWRLPLSQKETFALGAGTETVLDVRVKTAAGAVLGVVEPVRVRIVPAESRAVL